MSYSDPPPFFSPPVSYNTSTDAIRCTTQNPIVNCTDAIRCTTQNPIVNSTDAIRCTSQNPIVNGTDAIRCTSQNPNNNHQFNPHSQFEQQQQQQPLKRPRIGDEFQPNPPPYPPPPPPPTNLRMQVVSPVNNQGKNNIFFKTRTCAKFKLGACRNGEHCNFAHGVEDLRQPPPNWQEMVGAKGTEDDRLSGNWDDDQRIIHKMKLCKKFYNGEECPYGERCNFLHEEPSKFRDDSGRSREVSVINLGSSSNGLPVAMVNGSGLVNQAEIVNRPLMNNNNINNNNNNNATSMKPVYWKTRLCTKWAVTGHCPFGDKCHFAHGQAELQLNIVGRAEGETGNNVIGIPAQTFPSVDAAPVRIAPVAQLEGQAARKNWFKLKEFKKINRIYADWIDDLPLELNTEGERPSD